MAEHDDDSLDPDRAAILARRRHFVALALSGLATTACTDHNDKREDGSAKPPRTEANVAGETGSSGETGEAGSNRETGETESGSETDSAEQFNTHHPPPHACLKVAPPEPEPEPKPKPDPRPRPCLKKAAPKQPSNDPFE
jgi:hypothetical protein